ncbi:polysaccharide pyruvyl transferase family protein [Empedobacter stercoris]|uniref:polysaccharide pyruvyl transferase family protein n=1 Tax=Empedobacter stercoris TaxID=1628248 RepID=UPI0039ED01DE
MDNQKLEKIKKIAVLGPHDRVNFGDFLFPLMLDFSLSKALNINVELKKYSLVDCDFSYLGAFKSESFNNLTRDVISNEIDTIIVAGGESLSAKWNNLYSYINPIYDKFYQNKSIRNNRLFRNIPKLILGNKTEYPFIIDSLNYKNKKIKHFYNATGGAIGLGKNQIKVLDTANLIGIRDISSFNYLKNNLSQENITLVPDSAIILSDVYPINQLKKNIFGDYIFFQLSNFKYDNKLNEIISQLEELLINNHKIVLCPIGTAKGHEDHVVLKKIKNSIINDNLILIDNQPTIKDIISLIVNSRLYIGTSLHGIITSMSYGVPYIALNPKQIKVNSFLKTWSITELNEVCELNNFYSKVNIINNSILNLKICENTNNLKSKYYEFINQIVEEL